MGGAEEAEKVGVTLRIVFDVRSYTEHARRVVFFARYEASNAGASYIDTEHLLLGLIRESRKRLKGIFGSKRVADAIEQDTRQEMPRTEAKVPTSVDLPISSECKPILEYAAEEAARMLAANIDIGTPVAGKYARKIFICRTHAR